MGRRLGDARFQGGGGRLAIPSGSLALHRAAPSSLPTLLQCHHQEGGKWGPVRILCLPRIPGDACQG